MMRFAIKFLLQKKKDNKSQHRLEVKLLIFENHLRCVLAAMLKNSEEVMRSL